MSSWSANFSMAAARRVGTCSLGTSWALVALEDLAGDGDLVDLVGAVVDAGGAGVAVHRLEREVGGVAEAAVHLDGAVDHLVEHLGAPPLDHRDLDARPCDAPTWSIFHAGVQREEPGRLHLGGRGGDPVLHHLLLGQRGAVRVARQRPLAQHVEGPLALAEPAHGVVDAAGAEALLGQGEALAEAGLAADHVVEGDAHVAVDDLGVAAELAGDVVGLRHRGHVAHDLDTRACRPGR